MDFKTIKSSLSQVDSYTDSGLKQVFGSKWAQALLYLVIILYATKFAPSLPQQVVNLVDNQFFKIFVFFMVIWSAKHSPTTALVIAVAFLMTLNYINNVKMFEKLETDLKNEVLNTEIGPMTDVPQSAAGEVVLPPVVVEPKIVQTQDGSSMVMTPQVVIASKEFTTPSGEVVVITPEVMQTGPISATMGSMSVPSQMAPVPPLPEQMPAPSPEQMPAPSPEQMPAPSPEQAPAQAAPQAPPQAPPSQPYNESCFMMQSYDMSKVTGIESGSGFASI
jgi:hypothetical protein